MATLNDDTDEWQDSIYQLETTDPVVGGVPIEGTGAGMDNIPHLQLARRTRWLKAAVDVLNAAWANFVPTSRLVSTAGLATGGGSLAADRTITVPKATTAEALAGVDDSKALTPLTGAALLGNAPPTTRQILAAGLATGGGDLSSDRMITVPKASVAEAVAGTDDTKALTPLAAAGAVAAQMPRWRVTYDVDHTRDHPAGIVSAHPGYHGDDPSRGSIIAANFRYFASGYGGSYLFEMTLRASSAVTLKQYLSFIDDSFRCYLNGSIVAAVSESTTEHGEVAWPLISGDNLLQIVIGSIGGSSHAISLVGDLLSQSSEVAFVPM